LENSTKDIIQCFHMNFRMFVTKGDKLFMKHEGMMVEVIKLEPVE